MDILREALAAVRVEGRVMVATIIATSGSTPASAFSKMLLKDRCTTSVGTVGGGCVEADVLREARRLFNENRAAIMTFHLTEDHLESGMLCGGSLDVLIEPLAREHVLLLEHLQALRDDGDDCALMTVIGSDGAVREKRVISALDPRTETRRQKSADGETIIEPVAGLPALIIFGGGHVSRYVSRGAAMAGFRVVVVDDRPEFANPQRFPEAVRTVAAEFGTAFDTLNVKSSTFVVIVTRGHRSDEEVLEQAVKSPARYIGMIGSQQKVVQTFRNLMERGVSKEALQRVRAPIGIDIGAVTAEEIGISIVAELVHVRRGGRLPLRSKSEHLQW
jgi:xanthine dehydrogenase accessory factor